MSKWQSVYKSEVQHRAEIVKAVLDEHNLNPIIINKKDSAYKFGYYEILVLPDCVIQALKIIEDEIVFK